MPSTKRSLLDMKMKPILFDPNRLHERIQYTPDCPAAIVSEICGQLMAGVTDINELAQVIYSAGLVEEFEKDADDSYFADSMPYVNAVLDLLVALGFLSYYSKESGEWELQRPMSVDESFSQYFEERSKDD